MADLPFIDEHSLRVEAPPAALWAALVRVLTRRMGASSRFARLLGCRPSIGTPEFGSAPGQSIPGFRIAELAPGRRLVLEGRHRFARYRLTFDLADDTLVARTHAAFPGVLGQIYKTVVIRSGGHRLITRHMLRRVALAARSRSRPEA